MSAELTDEMKRIAEHAADCAIEKFFLKVGVDVSTPSEVIKVQKDFAQLRALTESIDLVRKRSIGAAVGVLVTGILGIIYAFFAHKGA